MVTDEMVEAGCKANFRWYLGEWITEDQRDVARQQVRTILDAALSAQVQDAPEKAGRFGHHPEPAIDFCIEVEALEGHLFDAKHGIGKTGHEPRRIDDEFRRRVSSAMDFIVGGDQIAIAAKATLRSISAQVQDVAGWPDDYYSDDPAKLKQLLAQRDKWLVDNGHWHDFTRSLPAAPAKQEV